MKFSQSIKRRRIMASMTQQQMADRLGVKVRRYAYWENGTQPPLEVILQLCEIFEATPNELLGFSQADNRKSKARMIADAIMELADTG